MNSLETVTAGSSPVTLANFKTFLKIDTSDEGTILQMCLDAATDGLQTYLKRVPVSGTFAFWMDRFPATIGYANDSGHTVSSVLSAEEFYLPFPPIQSITSIKTYDADNTEATLDSAAYSLDASSGRIFLNNGYSWPTSLRDVKAIKVTFVAGYGSATPAVLKQAVMLYAAQMYNDRCDCAIPENIRKTVAGYKLHDCL